MKIDFVTSAPQGGAVVVAAYKKGRFSSSAQAADLALSGALERAVKKARFSGKTGEKVKLTEPQGLGASHLLLLGLGVEEKDVSNAVMEQFSAYAVQDFLLSGETHMTVKLDGLCAAEAVAHAALGACLASYRFDVYRTDLSEEKKPSLKSITFETEHADQAEEIFKSLDSVAEGVKLARDLVSEPANTLYPASYVERLKELESPGLKLTVLGEKELTKKGFSALVGVGLGSERESMVAILEWNGGGKGEDPVAFVGKGVTFDTGGISLKPSGGMEEMTGDMGGSAAVIGTMRALAGRKAPVNAVGVVGLVENMPDGKAQRPGDVVTSLSGKTIEVLNTDAEGRLVLADALWYVQETYQPHTVIDLATLTGAMVIALGHEHAGLFSNDDDLADTLVSAGKLSDEHVWRMPLGEAYDRLLNSKIADMQNISDGRAAGSITAAQFLKRFIQDGVKWAHLDIAGTSWKAKSKDPREPLWATGFGVRLLDRWVRDSLEK